MNIFFPLLLFLPSLSVSFTVTSEETAARSTTAGGALDDPYIESQDDEEDKGEIDLQKLVETLSPDQVATLGKLLHLAGFGQYEGDEEFEMEEAAKELDNMKADVEEELEDLGVKLHDLEELRKLTELLIDEDDLEIANLLSEMDSDEMEEVVKMIQQDIIPVDATGALNYDVAKPEGAMSSTGRSVKDNHVEELLRLVYDNPVEQEKEDLDTSLVAAAELGHLLNLLRNRKKRSISAWLAEYDEEDHYAQKEYEIVQKTSYYQPPHTTKDGYENKGNRHKLYTVLSNEKLRRKRSVPQEEDYAGKIYVAKGGGGYKGKRSVPQEDFLGEIYTDASIHLGSTSHETHGSTLHEGRLGSTFHKGRLGSTLHEGHVGSTFHEGHLGSTSHEGHLSSIPHESEHSLTLERAFTPNYDHHRQKLDGYKEQLYSPTRHTKSIHSLHRRDVSPLGQDIGESIERQKRFFEWIPYFGKSVPDPIPYYDQHSSTTKTVRKQTSNDYYPTKVTKNVFDHARKPGSYKTLPHSSQFGTYEQPVKIKKTSIARKDYLSELDSQPEPEPSR